MHPNNLGGYSFPIIFGRGRGFEPVDLTVRQKMNINLQVPGKHNVQNALAALAVAVLLKLPLDKVVPALESFSGTGRRFELRGEAGGVTIIDDYAHHPTEIRATLAAARARHPGRRIIALWQPHTYSRTKTLLAEFASAFGQPGDAAVDKVLVTEVFAAREPVPMDGFTAQQVVVSMSHPDAIFIPDLVQAREILSKMLRRGDVLLVLSAGDADQLSGQVLDDLKVRDQELTGRGKTG
jgi:UDP-N-acetylmuramate--alanine ligase